MIVFCCLLRSITRTSRTGKETSDCIMANDRLLRVREDANAGRGGRGRRRADRQPITQSSRPANPRANRGGRGRSAKGNRSARRGVLHLLPQEIVGQSIVPFLVWRETSAMGCVCIPWSIAVRSARLTYFEWKTTVFESSDFTGGVREMALSLGRRNTRDCARFAPALAVVTLSFAAAESAPRDDRVWSELVETIVAEEIIPIDCVLVGSLDDSKPVHRQDQDQEIARGVVRMTVSMGVFPRTSVETAAFDRKALRWSANGLTEELDCPFTDVEEDMTSSASGRTSMLLWSANHKSSRAAIALVKQWYPAAPISGAEVTVASSAPPLMTYTRVKGTAGASKLQGRRKPKTTMESRGGVLSFPSALVVRLHGHVFLEPFSLCAHEQFTAILKNESLEIEEDITMMGVGRGVYDSVSVTDDNGVEVSASRRNLAVIIVERMARIIVNHLDMREWAALKLYASTDRHNLSLSDDDSTPYRQVSTRPIHLSVGSRGLHTNQDHWETGSYGVVMRRLSGRDFVTMIQHEAERLAAHVTLQKLTVLGGVVFDSLSSDSDLDVAREVGCAIKEACFHHSRVVAALGPVALPHGFRDHSPRLQVDAIAGFLLCALH